MADGPAEGYTGYRLAAPGDAIERIDAGSVDAASFFATYVAARKPVVLCGQPSGGDQENAESAEAREARVRNLVEAVLGAGARCWEWTNENLRQKAGDARVKVEYRSAESGSFGLGRKVGASAQAVCECVCVCVCVWPCACVVLHPLCGPDPEAIDHRPSGH